MKAVIFDCFGVLVGRGFDDTYRHVGGDPDVDSEFIAELLELGNRGQITREEFKLKIINQLGIDADVYDAAIREAEQPNYELLKYIENLRKKYKTAVLSNVNAGVLERKIGHDWLTRCFDEWVASAEVGYIKPEPEIYRLIAEKLGVDAKNCVFVDDREGYVEGAKNVGMTGIVYQDTTQCIRELEAILSAA